MRGAVGVGVPAEVARLGVLDAIDYADAFAVQTPGGHPVSARRWVDVITGEAPRWLRTLVRTLQEHVLGLRLAPVTSGAHPLGWAVLAHDAETVVLGVEGGLLTPRLVLTSHGRQLVIATLVRYDHPAARPLWAVLAPIHRAVARRLLDGGVRAAGRGLSEGEGGCAP